MNLKKILQKSWNIANALFAIASGLLTDLFYNIITEARIEGQIDDTKVNLTFVDSYPLWMQFIFILLAFITIWGLLSFILPPLYNYICSLIPRNMPITSQKEVYDVYCNCKKEIECLQNKVEASVKNSALNALYFTEVCMIVQKLQKVFLSEKKVNRRIVKETFRKSKSVNILDTNISDYEYTAVLKILDDLLSKTYNNVEAKNNLISSDYNTVHTQIEDMKKVR